MTRLLALLLCISLPAFGASYYGGPYVWVEDVETGGYYAPPLGAVGSLDLRGGDPNGNAVFVADSLPPPYILLGASLESTLGDKARAQWATLFGSEPPAGTLADALWWSVTTGAKEGVGLRPNRDGILRLTIAGETIREEAFKGEIDAYWPKLQERLQDDYRKVREASLLSNDDTYLKYLATLEEKYQTESGKFIADDLPKEEPVKPQTSYSDDFDRSDSLSVGGQWTEHLSGFSIVSNAIKSVNTNAHHVGVWSLPLSSDDHTVSASCYWSASANQTTRSGVMARKDESALTYYSFYFRGASNRAYYLSRWNNGTETQLDTLNEASEGEPLKLQIEVDGSDIICTAVGIGEIFNHTDSSPITGEVYVGVYGYQNAANLASWDDWQASDAVVPSETAVIEYLYTSGTWTKPADVTEVVVEVWGGGGGGGGSQRTTTNSYAAGGAGGQYAKKTITYSAGESGISYTVGAGGTGGTGTGGGAGGAGGDSTWDSTVVVAKGGAGGEGALDAQADEPGVGSTTGGVGDVVYAGGDGSAPTAAGGRGGGGAGSTGDGGDASGTTAGMGGIGGGGTGGIPNLAGQTYGGGGLGSNRTLNGSSNGFAGGQGMIRVTYYESSSSPSAAFAYPVNLFESHIFRGRVLR